MSLKFCSNCGKGSRPLPVVILHNGAEDHSSEPDPAFDDSSIKWIKIWTPYKLTNGETDYAYACSPKCAHRLEEFFPGGGEKCTVVKKDGKVSKTPWEPINPHL